MEAFILINTEPGLLWKVAEASERIGDVVNARAVTGQFDVIIYAEFAEINDLSVIIERLQSINGVVKTQTSIVMPTSAYTLQDEAD